MRFAGSARAAAAGGARRGGRRRDRHRASAARARRVGARAVSALVRRWPAPPPPTTSCSAPTSRFHFAPSGCVAKTLDFRTGVRRASTLQDLRECTALHRRAAASSTSCGRRSAPPTSRSTARELAEYFTMLTETSQARDVRRLPRRGRRRPAHLRGPVAATSSASASGPASRPSSPRPRRSRSTAPCSTSTLAAGALTACPSRSTR